MSQLLRNAANLTLADQRLSSGARAELVTDWHQRSRGFGLCEQQQPEFDGVGRADMRRLLDQHRMLYSHALPVMETLQEQIHNTHTMVILTDQNGLIMHAIGDDDFLRQAAGVALRPGVCWSERLMGTNAIGTALADDRATVVHADEHFLSANHFLTCSCAPIVDPHGKVLGALDVSGPQQSYHAHTMALVRMSTQMIENKLFADVLGRCVRLHFHARAEFVGTLMEGIAAFSEDGHLMALNRSAQFQLNLSSGDCRHHTMASVFGCGVAALSDRIRSGNAPLLTLTMHNGARVYARPELCMPSSHSTRVPAASVPHESRGPATALAPATSAPRRSSSSWTLHDLDCGDPVIGRAIDQVRKVLRHEIPLIISGESGTGKELLARAIHNESMRRDKAFVAVDCASIPESLIEAELFGYEDGAFTGAHRKGRTGQILLAHGGTLFLDEIGDMPVPLQARLLRVLQERTVTPLGSTKSIPVDLQVIAATHRNLREQIAAGLFRQDLYFRLNGLTVRLPALRERRDLSELVAGILAAQAPARRSLQPAAELMDAFRAYPWPGNIRQLSNVLRTACIMAGEEPLIERRHLPDDLLEDLAQTPPPSGPQSAPAVQTESLQTPLRALRRTVIAAALERCHGNVSAAARELKISRNTVYRSLRAARRVERDASHSRDR